AGLKQTFDDAFTIGRPRQKLRRVLARFDLKHLFVAAVDICRKDPPLANFRIVARVYAMRLPYGENVTPLSMSRTISCGIPPSTGARNRLNSVLTFDSA